MITEVHQEGRFYRLSNDRAAQYESLSHTIHRQKTADMEEEDYLMMDPACEHDEFGNANWEE